MNFKNYLKGIVVDADLIKNPKYIFFQKLPKNLLKLYWEDIGKNPIGLLFFPIHFIFYLFIFLSNFIPVSLRIIDTFINRKNWNSYYSKKEIKKLWSAGVSLEELKALENIGFSRKMVRAWISLGYRLDGLKSLDTEDISKSTLLKKFHEKRDLYYLLFFYIAPMLLIWLINTIIDG